MQPKVSMIVPCYNKVMWIGEMLDSVITQKWDNIEIILVNDGSTDGTCEVIYEYELKLKNRGYEVVVINQDNQGVAAAVRNGLQHVTGEFFCQVDCDDRIDSEYISEMAKYLCDDPEIMRVVCDAHTMRWDYSFALHESLKNESESPLISDVCNEKLLEKLLLIRVNSSLCLSMMRFTLILKLKIVEHFVKEPIITQEPQFFVPISIYETKTVYIRKPLYYYCNREHSLTSFETIEKINTYINKWLSITEQTLQNYITDTSSLNRYLSINRLARYELLIKYVDRVSGVSGWREKLTGNFVDSVNNSGLLTACLSDEQVLNAGFSVVYRAVSNYLIDYAPSCENILGSIAKTQGRLIAYGAGAAARYSLPDFKQCGIIPNIIWDIKAQLGDSLLDVPLAVPDFTSLTKKDTVIIFLYGNRDVEYRLLKTDAKVIHFQDVLNALAYRCFPGLVVMGND